MAIRLSCRKDRSRFLRLFLNVPGKWSPEEIQRKLWPDDTFVDFEHSINTAMKKLREALGDDAENPRFIETLPRRGYRFIAPVQIIEEKRTNSAAQRLLAPRSLKT